VTARRLGPYLLRRQIATSRMSSVWLADRDGGERVVVKLREAGSRRNDLEAAVSGLHHANVIEVVDRGELDGVAFVVMERLEGASVAKVMEACTAAEAVPPALWAHVIARAADGLGAIHGLYAPAGPELVHGDVSPQNLFVTLDGDVKVLDFDLVRRAGPPPPWELEGELAGTYPYLAPERVDRRPADRRADVFALGVILYEAVTLHRLFRGRTDAETLEKIGRHEVRPPHLLAPAIPRRLEGVVLRALRRDPAGRQATAAELAGELDAFTASPEAGAWARDELETALAGWISSLVDTSTS
jgi:eukaryotic-like serine/threonine-protein kinase